MEDQMDEWVNYEENNGSWIWEKGMSIGKKILVTGFVLSSAPVLLPPLVVISALGLACSVPCGVVLASCVCAEKIMSKLLPIPEDKYYAGEDSGFGDDYAVENEEEEEEDIRKKVEMMLDLVDEKGNEEEIGEPVVEIGKVDAEVEICQVAIEVDEEEEEEEVTAVGVELSLEDAKNDEEIVKETTGLLDKLRDEGMVDEEEAGNEKQSDENVQGDTKEGLMKDDTSAGSETDTQLENENADQTVGVENVKIALNVEQNGNKASGTGETVPAFESEKVSDKMANGREEDNKSTEGEKPTLPGGGTALKVLYSEENMWTQIDAMRNIVGYTAGRHETFIEELKALYVFTGVEPPAASKDPSDLVEVNEKLKFLMSIVGVK